MSTLSEKPSLARYEIIEKDIIEKIQKGEFHAGDRIPSEKELVAEYGVSRITATKALNELALSGYIQRIQGKGSFANQLGSQMRIDSSCHRVGTAKGPRRIALIIPEHCDYHSGNIIRAVNETLVFPEYYVNLILNNHDGIEEYTMSHLEEDGYEGAILFPGDCEFYSDTILKLHLSKFPLVLVDRCFPGIHCSSVTSDNRQGIMLGMDHLFSLGHTRIAYVSDSSYKEQISSLRYNAYIEYMAERGQPVCAYESFFHDKQSASQHTDFLSKINNGEITAAFASNSHVATRLLQLCRKNGVSIPQQLSLVCFDSPIVSQDETNFYTYVNQDSYGMGLQAANILADALQSQTIDVRQVVLKPQLVVNDSTQAILKG